MARAASKKQAAQNAVMVRILTYGFLISNTIHLFFVFGPFKSKTQSAFWNFVKYALTEVIAGALGVTLRGMAQQGDDLGQHGLTSYMFDIIYVTWFVHVFTAIFSSKFWYAYALIPLYALSIAYSKVIVPFVLGGRDPLRSLTSVFSAQGARSSSSASSNGAHSGQAEEPAMSKRQAKLQKRAERGDPRVQKRQT